MNSNDTVRIAVLTDAVGRLQKIADTYGKTLSPDGLRKLTQIVETIEAIAEGKNQALADAARALLTDSAHPKTALGDLIATIKRNLADADGVNFERIQPIRCSEILAGPNDRQHFTADALQELADSIRENGLTVPIILRPLTDRRNGHKYEIVAGERRFRAISTILKEPTIAAIVREMDDQKAATAMLTENIGRVDLNLIEEGSAYDTRMKRFGWSVEKVAKHAGKTTVYVLFRLKLLKLIEPIRQMLIDGNIQLGYAQIIADAELDDARQAQAIKHLAMNDSPSLAWFRQLVGELKAGQMQNVMELVSAAQSASADPDKKNGKSKKKAGALPTPLTTRPDRATGTKVEIVEYHIAYWKKAARQWTTLGKNFRADQCTAAAAALGAALQDLS